MDLEKVSEGQLFTGRMALDLGLVDAIGSQEEVLKYLQTYGEKFKDIKLLDWSLEKKSASFWNRIFGFYNPMFEINRIKIFQSPMLFSIAS